MGTQATDNKYIAYTYTVPLGNVLPWESDVCDCDQERCKKCGKKKRCPVKYWSNSATPQF